MKLFIILNSNIIKFPQNPVISIINIPNTPRMYLFESSLSLYATFSATFYVVAINRSYIIQYIFCMWMMVINYFINTIFNWQGSQIEEYCFCTHFLVYCLIARNTKISVENAFMCSYQRTVFN